MYVEAERDGMHAVSVQADLFAGALFLQTAFNWNIYAATIALLVVAALFTIAGLILCYTFYQYVDVDAVTQFRSSR